LAFPYPRGGGTPPAISHGALKPTEKADPHACVVSHCSRAALRPAASHRRRYPHHKPPTSLGRSPVPGALVDDREAQLEQCVLADLRVAERTWRNSGGTSSPNPQACPTA